MAAGNTDYVKCDHELRLRGLLDEMLQRVDEECDSCEEYSQIIIETAAKIKALVAEPVKPPPHVPHRLTLRHRLRWFFRRFTPEYRRCVRHARLWGMTPGQAWTIRKGTRR